MSGTGISHEPVQDTLAYLRAVFSSQRWVHLAFSTTSCVCPWQYETRVLLCKWEVDIPTHPRDLDAYLVAPFHKPKSETLDSDGLPSPCQFKVETEPCAGIKTTRCDESTFAYAPSSSNPPRTCPTNQTYKTTARRRRNPYPSSYSMQKTVGTRDTGEFAHHC